MATQAAKPQTAEDSARLYYAKTPTTMMGLLARLQDRLESGELRSVTFGISEVDQVIRTMWAGRLTTIVARPGMGKTSVMVYLARRECQRLMRGEGQGYVLFVTLEESEEEVHMAITEAPATVAEMIDGTHDSDALRRHTLEETTRWPLFMLGYEPTPLAGKEPEDAPDLTVGQIFREVGNVEKQFDLRPSAIFVDYLQILETGGDHEGRNQQVATALRELKKLAQLAECPIFVGVQAKERVDEKAPPVPQQNDAYYSSEVYHASDVMISLWWPENSAPDKHNGAIQYSGKTVTVTPHVFWLQLLKQRKGQPRHHWLVYIDMVQKRLGPLEARR